MTSPFKLSQDSPRLIRLVSNVVDKGYQSFDPYDGLATKWSHLIKRSISRRIWVQFVKRSPVWLRFLAGIPKHRMSVVLAQFLEAATISNGYLDKVDVNEITIELISKQNLDGGWGYEFDASLRWGSYSANESNLIATYFCVRALNLVSPSGSWKQKARDYLENQFHNGYFRYANSNESLIHNANVLGAHALYICSGSSSTISEALLTTLGLQNSDGSWWYGETSDLQWVDGFHTCYILISLLELQAEGYETNSAFVSGATYWLNNLFAHGRPKYFSTDLKHTTDLNTISCALQLAVNIYENSGENIEQKGLVRKLHFQLLDQLSRDRRLNYAFRWKSAPATLALTRSIAALSSANG